ncbi:MAG: hypothetical protein B7Z18_11145, partial [Alishewanella sp. 32-51-5]
MKNNNKHAETLCIHAGKTKQPYGALSTPIYQTSTFVFDNAEQGAARFAGEQDGYIYTRLGNPTTRELELKVAALEGMADAAATATGMGAVAAATLAFLQQGDHLIASKAIYGCSFALFSHQFARYGIEVSFVDMTDHAAVIAAIKPNTKMLFAETPINPHLVVLDLAFLCGLCRQHNILSVIDNTFLTPLLQQPAKFGADIIIHSATKYLNGHGDVVAGIIVSDEEKIRTIKLTTLKDMGATISPHDAWLIIRGLKTLSVRLERHCSNAQKVAEYLAAHPAVAVVHYPGLPGHPGYRFLGNQMQAAGGVLAFELNASLEQRVRERTAELERTMRDMEAISYSIAHDLRAPLRSVNGFAQVILEEEGDRLSENGRQLFERIARSSRNMGQMITDMLELLRVV